MNRQNQWLFEAPFASPIAFSGDRIERELFSHSPAIYFNPESESDPELYEQYRRHNQRFRKVMANFIGSRTNHPLKFLVKLGKGGQWIWRMAKNLRVDAGHGTPVMNLSKQNYKTERLFIQDRNLNRSDGARMGATGKGKRIKGVLIQGVPIDLDTLKKYVAMGLLHKTWLKKAQPHRGWTPSRDKELHFILGEFHDWISQENNFLEF